MAPAAAHPLRSEELALFQVILDEPADSDKLGAGFGDYATALADVVVQSKAQFAIGIFGDWGSGKTTLMKAIQARVESPETVPVWFNAWRYEKEEHLIVPLLDTLRAELLNWGERHKSAKAGAREAAKGIGRAARALVAGLSLTVGLPPVQLGFDGGEALKSFSEKPADEATSFYFASFNELQTTLSRFVTGGVRRIVVFIDDLDRCLPNSALEVLESMKLFFDLEGFVFVVGLDQGVIERSIEAKYQSTTPVVVLDRDRTEQPTASQAAPRGPAPGAQSAPISGAEYVKKIFQVPFTLPRISTSDLETFFGELLDNAPVTDEQREHTREQLGPHLAFLSGKRPVNPRELKRMMNAYTVQAKMLNAKLIDFDPEALVVLLTIRFRTEWDRIYDALAGDPATFVDELNKGLNDANLRVLGEAIPQDFLEYVKGVGGRLLEGELEPYISSVESTHAGDPTAVEGLKIVQRLRAEIADFARAPDSTALESVVHGDISLLRSEMSRASPSSGIGEEILKLASELDVAASQLSGASGDARDAAVAQLRMLVDRIYDNLRELRRQTTTGAPSS